jgi:sigma-B regulation protein RsbU (phosphoserine phosphatase)
MLDHRATALEIAPAPGRAPRLLLADDDAISRRLLGAALERSGFEMRTAVDGDEALRLAHEDPPDLLVLDFEMPALNGAEICHRLRASEREELRALPVVMLTAHAGEAEEIACLHAGANDFVTKPVSREVLTARIHTQLRLRALADELRRQNEQLEHWRTAQEADLEAARATQQALIPTIPPSIADWSVQTVYQPVIQVGGDVFGWRSAGQGRWIFWLADATGHGAAAALFTALAAQLFHHACESESEPSAILRAVNHEFCRVFSGRSFMTACCALVDPQGGLSFCSAGHPPLLVRRADGAVESFGPHSTVLGLRNDEPPDQSRTMLAAGDTALLYTDGLFSLRRPDGERFTHHDLSAVLPDIAPGESFFDRLLDTISRRSDGDPTEDDVAGIVLGKIQVESCNGSL